MSRLSYSGSTVYNKQYDGSEMYSTLFVFAFLLNCRYTSTLFWNALYFYYRFDMIIDQEV